ncbi:glycine betaine/proline transport system substrate-binding protein [Natranaerovirga hydrolytica]|uniref:Glycine betaine/proline transport system substrate-binding protein n=1 Tax=Natranaerovirga hydrolytica TaxID=680378 RepID=A0A4R1MZH3_9FIRM|nr:glycine betaine ABC transporter substrate-binding protein [Natranaerovirga hydrolytica]TCK98010.1 glycine betaine/proline transport system substrate-binding protein [Natranaerovirga hydrolytica]
MKKLSLILVLVLSIGLMSFVGCDTADEDTQEVKLAYVNWAEGIAMNYLVHSILEDDMGYQVESTQAQPGVIFASLAEKDYDLFVDAWLPVTHESYMEEFGDDLVDLGYNFEGARIGLVVPSYVDIDSIDELNDVVDNFGGEIIGIGPGAGIMAATNDAIDVYDLDFDLVESSDPVMVTMLSEGISDGEWVAVTGWEPHHKFASYDLKFLDDPEGVFGAVENIHTVARDDIHDYLPEVAQLLENFYLDSEQLGDLMGDIAESGDDETELDVARRWKEANQDLVNSWIPEQ